MVHRLGRLAAGAAAAGAPVAWIYLCAATSGVAQVVNRPSRDALLPQIVPAPMLANAIAWNTSLSQIASVTGPALAGLLIAAHGAATIVYALNAAFAVVALALSALIGKYPLRAVRPARSWRELFVGLEHVWRTRVILGVITLDLLAVLFGGATALLPLYAKDILHAGPAGLGWLYAAPAIGAIGMAVTQGFRRPFSHAGRAFFWSVAGFGLATVVFGYSSSFWLSLAMLVVIGALDNVSVVTRQSVVLLHTAR